MNYKIKAILLEDEINALELNERIIHQIEDIELLASYQSILEAEKNIIQLKPKLLFLDIKIRGRYVFEMLDRLKEQQLHFSIIFISAYIKEQLENIIDTVGFEKFPFGYIHKPLSLDK